MYNHAFIAYYDYHTIILSYYDIIIHTHIHSEIPYTYHILRSNDNDPLRRVSYEPNSAVTFDVGKRRVGGPRQQWTQYSNKYAWENALGKGRYENTAQQNQELFNCARSRQFWKQIASACPRFHTYANTGMKPWLRKKNTNALHCVTVHSIALHCITFHTHVHNLYIYNMI